MFRPPLLPFSLPAIRCQTRHASSSRSTSSKLWLSRQKSDPLVGNSNFVARSAHKLLELQQKSRGTLIKPGMTVVDLGAAPGGWVQAAEECFSTSTARSNLRGRRNPSRIIAVDLLALHPEALALPSVTFIRGDFLDPIIQSRVASELVAEGNGDGKVDLVLSDMLANMSGSKGRDAQLSLDLCLAALEFAVDHLRPFAPSLPLDANPSSNFHQPPPSHPPLKPKETTSLIMKFLQSDLTPTFSETLKSYFTSVRWEKPSSSRPESREGYWVCSGFKGKGTTSRPSPMEERGKVKDQVEEVSIFF